MKTVIAAFLILACAAGARCADVTWSGEGSGGWSDGANWEGSVPPSEGDTAVVPAGATATLSTADDIALANSLAAISLPYGDSALVVANSSLADLYVPVTGVGMVTVSNGQKVLNLFGDNTGFSGPFLFTNSYVVVRNRDALGNANVVTNYSVAALSGSTPTRLEIEAPGMYANEFHLFGLMSSGTAWQVYYCEKDCVTNSGPCYVYGASTIQGPSGFSGFGFVTFSGGFHHEGVDYAYINRKVRIIGDVPCNIRTTSDHQRGGICVMPDGELEFGAPVAKLSVLNDPTARIATQGGILRFVAPSTFPDDNQGAIAFGNASRSNNNGGTIDFNGNSITLCDIVKDPNAPTEPMVLTSAVPATVTIRGTFYRYGFYNWKEDQSKVANLRLEGKVSYELDSVQTFGSGRFNFGNGHTYFTNETSNTRGFLSVARGTMRLGADTSWPNLSELRARDNGVLLVDTDSVNPGKFIFSVADSAKVTLADGLLLDAKKASVGGKYLDPGVYGGPDAGLDAEHTLSCLEGGGRIKVRRPGRPGLSLYFR